MRRFFLLFFLLAFILGCNSADRRIDDEATAGAVETTALKPSVATGENPGKTSHVIRKITAEEFKQEVFDYSANKQWVFAGDKPCIVDFYADWCGPCKMLAPTLEKIARQYEGQITVYKVNIDEQEEVARVFGISSIPTLLLCPRNNPPQMTRGLLQEDELKKAVDEVVLK